MNEIKNLLWRRRVTLIIMHVTEETTPPLMHKNYAVCRCSLTSTIKTVASLDYAYPCTQFPDIQPSA